MPTLWKVRTEATAFRPDQFPSGPLAEIAVAGRSNVGKSSLINRLLGTRLARVAAAPGKTRSVNFFIVEGVPAPFRLVDLPGYGYASRSKGERNQWSTLIERYISGRKNLELVLHLVDFRHGLLENDRDLQEWLRSMKIPLLVVFTKGDKISRSHHRSMVQNYIREGLFSIDVPLVTSAEKGDGFDDLRGFMEEYIFRGEEQNIQSPEQV